MQVKCGSAYQVKYLGLIFRDRIKTERQNMGRRILLSTIS